jgi:hypothetical protein
LPKLNIIVAINSITLIVLLEYLQWILFKYLKHQLLK